MKTILTLFVLGVFLVGCNQKQKKEAGPDGAFKALSNEETLQWVISNVDSVLVRNTFTASNGLEMPYRLFTPNEAGREAVPLVIFLHGRGDRGTDNGPQLYKSSGLFMNARSLLAPNMQDKYPCYVLVPQCSDKTENEEWAKWVGNTPQTPFEGLGKDGSYIMHEQPSESGAATLELIDKLIDSLQVDADRVYLIGKSMGGFGTWEFTSRRPELFAAAVPMAGFSDPRNVERIKHIPFWIFHGDTDKYNPVEGSRTMSKLLSRAGADVKYTEYAGVGHIEAFEKGFNEPDLIPWIFSKKKGN